MRTLRAQRLAWAGVRLQLDHASLWIDPLVNSDVWGPSLRDPLFPLEPGAGDHYVLVTHRHPDHFDPTAIRAVLGDSGTLVCAPEAALVATSRGFKLRVAPLYEPTLLGDDFTVTAVPAVDGYGDPQVS
jgi:L-ascorbate metabolism protein UlaG (beta-lactamase superfamily)